MPPARRLEVESAIGLEVLAREQAALRRVATLVAEAAPADELFAAVAEELGSTVLEADVAFVGRYESGDALEFVGGWSREGNPVFVGQRVNLGGNNVSTLVLERNAPARVDHLENDAAPATALAREWARSAAGAPINVEGRLWGVMIVGSLRVEGLPQGIEDRLANFTDLIATAIANAQARDDLRRLAEEQASLRRLATLVAQGAAPEPIFAAVVDEVAEILGLERIEMARYEPDGTATMIGASRDHPFPPGSQWVLDGPSLLLRVQETGRPARIDDYGSLSGSVAAVAREGGLRSGIGAPLIVDGGIWGAIFAMSTGPEPIPERSEARLAQITDLVALAISNATARAGLTALADEQAALRRVATLVARGAPPTEIFSAVAEEVGGLLGPDHAVMARFDAPDVVSIMAEWTSTGDSPRLEKGRRLSKGGIAKLVQDTGRIVRVDDYAGAAGDRQSWVLDAGTRAAVAAPITVDGRLWGVMGVGSRGAPPSTGTEARLAHFTELVATAIANTQAREELRTIADEQAALRRVATLVAESAPGPVVFAAVADEVGQLLRAERTFLARFDADDVVTIVGAWPDGGSPTALGLHGHLDEAGLSRLVRATNRPARVGRANEAWAALPSVRRLGLQSAVGAPISVQGRIWGMIEVASTSAEPVALGTEERLAGFTELVATAIANSQARGELSALADEQAALRRVATLVAEGAPPDTVFAAVSAEGARLFDAQCGLLRYDPEGVATIVGLTDIAEAPAVGTQVPLGGHNATTLVFESGRPARIDSFPSDDSNPLTVMGRTVGRSAVGAPIHVAGRLWGVVALNSLRSEPFAQDTEARLEGFAELVATAIANAEARAELTASRARVIATADETRRRIERDLHDGVQQRLVTIGLQLRAAQAAVPPEFGELAAELERVVGGLTIAFDELREYARGIHPAVLMKGGLAPALKALARRSTVPVELDVQIAARLPERIELGAYYVISEALTNAAKHASATRLDIGVEEADGLLRLTVRDDGTGGARYMPGSGLVGLKDRVEALGGRLSVDSPPGAGTTLQVEIPLAGGGSG